MYNFCMRELILLDIRFHFSLCDHFSKQCYSLSGHFPLNLPPSIAIDYPFIDQHSAIRIRRLADVWTNLVRCFFLAVRITRSTVPLSLTQIARFKTFLCCLITTIFMFMFRTNKNTKGSSRAARVQAKTCTTVHTRTICLLPHQPNIRGIPLVNVWYIGNHISRHNNDIREMLVK